MDTALLDLNEVEKHRLTYHDIINCNDIIQIAQCKFQCRSLQGSLLGNDIAMRELIYKKAFPVFHQLLTHQYGNYLSQKILERCSDTQFDDIFDVVKNDLPRLASVVHGTRSVQKFVEEAVKRNRAEAIVQCLKPYVENLSVSVRGFHVIVKLLEKLPPRECEDILSILCRDATSIVQLGIDQWGCCVLKTCIDVARGARATLIQEAIINSSLSLIQDAFGNYVVQHLLQHDNKRHAIPQMIDKLKDHALELSQQKFSSNVLEKLLTTASDRERLPLIHRILDAMRCDTAEVEKVLFHPYGNYVLQKTLLVAQEPEYSLLIQMVRPSIHDALRTSFGQRTDSKVEIGSGISSHGHGNESTLATEQAHRLVLKLAKRFPSSLEGLDEDIRNAVTASQWNREWNEWKDFDFSTNSVMFYDYASNIWDESYWPQANYNCYIPQHTPKISPRLTTLSPPSTQRPSSREEMEASTSPESLRSVGSEGRQSMGRIVGCWPHYTIAYDTELFA